MLDEEAIELILVYVPEFRPVFEELLDSEYGALPYTVTAAFGRFVQGPLEGEEDDWPFVSDFRSDTALLGEGEYYPKTM